MNKRNFITLAAAALAVCATTAQARIGWTEAEFEAKFGKAREKTSMWQGTVPVRFYYDGDVVIRGEFFEGKAYSVDYFGRANADGSASVLYWTLDEAMQLLKKNSDRQWFEDKSEREPNSSTWRNAKTEKTATMEATLECRYKTTHKDNSYRTVKISDPKISERISELAEKASEAREAKEKADRKAAIDKL